MIQWEHIGATKATESHEAPTCRRPSTSGPEYLSIFSRLGSVRS